MNGLDVFLSATGLVWCALFSLIMIGIVFFIKNNTRSTKIDEPRKVFIFLYILTLLLIINEFILHHAFEMQFKYPTYTLITSKIYVFIGLLWNFIVLMYYIILYLKKKNKLESRKIHKILNTIVLCIILIFFTIVLSFPVEYVYDKYGFWILSGALNTVYNRLAIVCDAALLLFILKNRNILSKDLVIYSLIIFALYIGNLYLEGAIGYAIKDAIFMYSLFVSVLYYTTESQDKQMSEEYEIARQQSVEIDKQKTNFLLNMSHEIRTPLNTIMGYSDYLLMEENFTKDKIEMEGENVYQASEILLSLINNILDVSRIESGKETLVETDYKLDELVETIYEKILPRTLLRNNVKFNLEIDKNLPANYNGDAAKLERILISILQNAVEHTTMGEVKLKVEGQRKENVMEMTYTIRNAGHEMKEDKFNIDFNSITSLETTENIDNNVLGIIIAKQLLTIMDGTIEFINKPGHGTQYIIRMKQKCYGEEKVGNIVDKIKKSTEEELINCEGKVALVADDNAINLNIAKRLLVKFGFTVETCLSGQECIELAKEKKYDIIFLDHMMPGMDGVETLNHLKEEHGQIPPTIALTANASDDSRSEYMNLGFTDYLTKPIDTKELDKILKRLFK